MRLTPAHFLRQLFATRTKRTVIATVCALAVGATAAVAVTMYVRADPPANRTSADDTEESTGDAGTQPESASQPASPSGSVKRRLRAE